VRAQTMPDWELVFWDNQSNDGSAARIRQYSDPRIHYFMAPEHTKLDEARRRAASRARGRWIGVLDTDDLWLPDKLERQLARVANVPEVRLVYGRCEELNLLKEVAPQPRIHPPLEQRLPEGRVFGQLARDNFMSLVSILYRRDAMEEVGGFREFDHAADYDLSLRLARQHLVAAVDAVICRYRQHEDNRTHRLFEVGVQEVEAILTDLREEPGAREGLRQWRARHAWGWLAKGRLGKAGMTWCRADKREFARLAWRGMRRWLGGQRTP